MMRTWELNRRPGVYTVGSTPRVHTPRGPRMITRTAGYALLLLGCTTLTAPAPAPARAAPATTRPADPAASLDVKCRKLADEWKARFAAEKFNAVVAAPFVI